MDKEAYVLTGAVGELEEELKKKASLNQRLDSEKIYKYSIGIEAVAAENGVSNEMLRIGLTNILELLVRYDYIIEAKSIKDKYRL